MVVLGFWISFISPRISGSFESGLVYGDIWILEIFVFLHEASVRLNLAKFLVVFLYYSAN